MSDIALNDMQPVVDGATSPFASFWAVFMGCLVFFWDNAPKVVAVLTAILLIFQICAWLYKFYLWLKTWF